MRLIKILRDRIQIKTDDFEFEEVRINDLIRITDGVVHLVTMVTSMTDSENTETLEEYENIAPPSSIKVIDCTIIGSVENGKFSKTVDFYPTTDVIAALIAGDDFSKMLITDTSDCFLLGQYSGYECPAWINGNKFFQRHSCIVGNTGSGKSETVAKILEELSKLPGANAILFDIHGEYSGLSYVDNIKIGENAMFPIWFFSFTDMVTNILKIKEETSGVYMSALRKAYACVCQGGNEGKPQYYNFDELISVIRGKNAEMVPTGEYYKTGDKAGMAKLVKGDYNGKLGNVVNAIEAIKSNKRYGFLFESADEDYLPAFLERVIAGDKPVKNIDLSDVPHDIAIVIIGIITKLVYGIRLELTEKKPITLICDEAHVYIPNNFSLSPSERRSVEIFENIAKEGRKFGVSLFVASQRPSELNKTIMAQCANFIVSKLNNENDKSMIKGMLPDGSENIIDSTTMFSPGDVLVIGDASQIPLKIHVDLAKERPHSRTIDFWDEWKKEGRADIETAFLQYMKN